MKPFIKQAFVVSGAALNIVGHGCAHGFPAVLFSQLESNGGIPVKLSDHDMSWIASVVGIMGIVGNFISPVLMTRLGRQRSHLITTAPALLGWLVFYFANSVGWFLVARLLHGLALGLRTPLAAILVAEYTDPGYRGAFLGTFAVSLGMGIFLSHLLGAHLAWTSTAAVCAAFPVVALGIISLSPESPSWLIAKGRFDEARKAFRWLRGDGKEQMDELEDMICSQKSDLAVEEAMSRTSNDSSFTVKGALRNLKKVLKIFKKKEFYKPALVAITMLIIFEFGGAHMIPAYGNRILQSVLDKPNPKDVNWHFTIIDLLRMVCAFVAIFLLKYFKRRTILFSSGIMTVISLTSISVFIYLRQSEFLHDIGVSGKESWFTYLPMTLMIVYTVSFCLGLVPLTWVICGEVFPLAYRSLGSTISTSFLTPSFVISMKTAPHLFSAIGVEGAFLVFSAVLTAGLLIIYTLLPETKDKTLQEIENSFKNKDSGDPDVEMKLFNKDDVVTR